MSWECRCRRLDFLYEFHPISRLEWVLAGAHEIQRASAGPQVLLATGVLLTLASFWRVVKCSASVSTSHVSAIEGQHERDPKVCDLYVIFLVYQYIVWLYVPMDYLYTLVAIFQRLNHLPKHPSHRLVVLAPSQPFSFIAQHSLFEGAFTHELCYKVEFVLLRVVDDLVEFDQVRMVELLHDRHLCLYVCIGIFVERYHLAL